MALSSSSQKSEQVRDTSILSNTSFPSYSTPRQFTTAVHDNSKTETHSMSKTRSPLPASNFKDVTRVEGANSGTLASSIPLLPRAKLPTWTPLKAQTLEGDNGSSVTDSDFRDVTRVEGMNSGKLVSSVSLLPRSELPTWTPLKAQTLEGDDGSLVSDSEADVDELSAEWSVADLTLKRPRESPTNVQMTKVESTVPTEQTLKPSSNSTKGPRRQTARFDGVVITTRSPAYKDRFRKKPGPASRSNTRVSTSLVDALAKTFDANRHTESPPARRPHGDRSTVPQTDVETTTDAEDDRFQLNTRLARLPLRRQRPRAQGHTAVSTHVSETNSEDATPPILQRGLIPRPERPVKQPRAVQYEPNAALIDAALGTVQAPVSWDAELDFITRGEDFVTIPVQTAVPPASPGMGMAVDEDDLTHGRPRTAYPQTQAGDGWRTRTRTRGEPKKAVLLPYLSHGARFRQRLVAIFGENATVRTDRAARPRSIEYDFYAPFRELERAPSPGTSGSIVSVNFASTAEEGASAIPSTHITSQSPNTPSSDVSMDRSPRDQPREAGSVTEPVFDASEEQVIGWVTALQRLIKGKVHVREEDLEKLSIILAEIESVKDSLGNIPMTLELRRAVKQLAELPGIPFGDRNKLRERANHILHAWPSVTVLGTS